MPSLRHAPIAALAALVYACAPGGRHAPPAPVPAAECVVGGVEAGDSSAAVTVAVTTLLDPAHAPWPRNPGERLLFAQLYEPLVRLDCTGAIVSGIARSWEREGAPAPAVAQWKFVLRDDAHFANGESLRAADVISSWRASASAHAREPVGSLLATIASGAQAVSDSVLVVAVPESLADVRAFASPQLAVARPGAAGAAWPDGTTAYYLDSTGGPTRAGVSGGLPVPAEIGLRTPGGSKPLLFQVEPDADGRDILDAGVDVLITSSPAAIQYSRTQPGRVAIPLPWARSYLLVLPARSASRSDMGCDAADLRPLREALAQAVHVAARGAAGPCWWHSDSSDAAASGRSSTGSRQILYPIHDATARELAERIVALAAPGRDEPATAALHRAAPEIFGTGGWSAAGADSARFAERLARASDAAYILSIPHDPAWAAAARATLLSRAPWLAPLDRTQALVPLVDTRETLLIRRDRGIPRMTILHDGTVILDPLTNAPARARTSERTSERTSAHTSTSANASVNRAP